MKNISDKSCRENRNTYFVFSNFFFENRAGYEIMWTNLEQRGRPQMTIWRIRTAHCVTKAANTHSEYVILIAFPQQQWWHERASMLRHKYISSLVCGLGIDLHDIVCRCVSISLDYTALNSGMTGE
jgi:hypothetical protein